MIPVRRTSALSHRRGVDVKGVASLREAPFLGKLILRGKPEVIGKPVEGVIGAALPLVVKRTARGARALAVWTAPDEWWLVAGADEEKKLAADLAAALKGIHHQVADVTDYYTTIRLAGPRTREMLMTLATVDLHPRAFKSGEAVLSNLGRSNPLLVCTGEDSFDIHIRISMADYLWCSLLEAGHEWGLPEERPKGEVKLHLPHFGH
jgi:sarcosine oxidase subunit gamma